LFSLRAVKFLRHLILALLGLLITYSCENKVQGHTPPRKIAPPDALRLDTFRIVRNGLYQRLDSYFHNRNRLSGFNGNVLITKGGRVVYKGCFGYADYPHRDTLQPNTPFHIASTGKPFTATAILKLVEMGKLSLDDPLQKFFPKLPYTGITIQHLLCHRSGLPNYLHFGDKLWHDRHAYLTNDALISILIANPNILGTTRPNTHFQYCNTNYALLASIVERVSGQRFPDFMRQTFFEPLGMRNTWVRDVRIQDTTRHPAITYNSRWVRQAEDPYDGIYGDKDIFSTMEDMMIWDKAFYDEKNISQAMQRESYTPRSFEKKGTRNYGYGWRLMQQPNGQYLVYHNGWWHGNNTVFCRYIPDTFTLIILANRYNTGVYNIQPIFNIISGGTGEKSTEEEE
jgi:CubicO group peptidase (beta-lactamase class C family)